MSYVAKDTGKDVEAPVAAKTHKIRITLTSRKVASLEKGQERGSGIAKEKMTEKSRGRGNVAASQLALL
ncbi:hypothetical protein JCM10207_003643 [Rhodosporidiobolus poonsookiae]